jgi:hypothetical protein
LLVARCWLLVAGWLVLVVLNVCLQHVYADFGRALEKNRIIQRLFKHGDAKNTKLHRDFFYHYHDSYMAQNLRKHSANIKIIIFAFLSFSLFCCESGPPPGMTDPGELIYFGYVNKQAQCSRCHGDEGQGGMFGPPIRGVLQKLGVDSVRSIIVHGKGEGDKRMPGLAKELTPEQIEQVIGFLQKQESSVPADSSAIDETH